MVETFPDLVKEVLSKASSTRPKCCPSYDRLFVVETAVSPRRNGTAQKRHGTSLVRPGHRGGLGPPPPMRLLGCSDVPLHRGLIPTGSLLASYIATSDEAIPVLMANPDTLAWVLQLLGTSLGLGRSCRYCRELRSATIGQNPKAGFIPRFSRQLPGRPRQACRYDHW